MKILMSLTVLLLVSCTEEKQNIKYALLTFERNQAGESQLLSDSKIFNLESECNEVLKNTNLPSNKWAKCAPVEVELLKK